MFERAKSASRILATILAMATWAVVCLDGGLPSRRLLGTASC